MIRHAWHFYYALVLVIKVVCGSIVLRASHLNWALCVKGVNVRNRESKKLFIQGIPERLDFLFDKAIENSENELRNDINELEKRSNEVNEKHSCISWDDLDIAVNGIPDDVEDILYELSDLHFDLEVSKEKLKSLVEMKVINLYKTYEIILKELISHTFPNQSNKSLYQWENVKGLMAEHEIKFGEINEYPFINQLRLVNNNIKHSPYIEGNVKKTLRSSRTMTSITVTI